MWFVIPGEAEHSKTIGFEISYPAPHSFSLSVATNFTVGIKISQHRSDLFLSKKQKLQHLECFCPFSFLSVPKQVCGKAPVIPAKATTLTSETRGSGWLQATQAFQGSGEPGKVYLGQVARLSSHFLLLISGSRPTIRRKSYLRVLGEANGSHLSFLPNSLGSALRLPADLAANPGD